MPNAGDPFSGTWKLNVARSAFDPHHRPRDATMCFEQSPTGYRMTAEGIKEDGQPVTEAPLIFHLDGQEHSLPGSPGVATVCARPDPNTITVEARSGREIVGRASYVVSEDGKTLTATVQGIDAQQRPFDTKVVFERG